MRGNDDIQCAHGTLYIFLIRMIKIAGKEFCDLIFVSYI